MSKQPHEIDVRFATGVGGHFELDEVVAMNATVHLEKMNDGEFCLIVETRHERACFGIRAKAARGHIDAAESWRALVNRRSEAQKRRWSAKRHSDEERERI